MANPEPLPPLRRGVTARKEWRGGDPRGFRPDTAERARRLAFLGALSVLGGGLLLQACTTQDVTGVVVAVVTVSPGAVSLLEGGTQRFVGLVSDDSGRTLTTAVVQWSSDDETVLSIDSAGLATAVARGTATVRAQYRGVSGEAEATVIPAPKISLSAEVVSFFGGAGDPSPAAQVLSLSNGGGGTLGGLTTSVQFPTGDSVDWVAATLAGPNAATTLTLTPETAGLPVGQYLATVLVASPDDRHSPVLLPVTLSINGLTIAESGGSTVVNEAGSTDELTVVLDSQPASQVVLEVTSGDIGEVALIPTTLTFTHDNWDVPQTVTVTGQDDAIADGDVATVISVSVDDAGSDEPFHAIADRTVTATTTDDDVAGITVTPTSGLTTDEAGGQATFTVVLDTEPTADVTIAITSSDTSEGTVSTASLTFTPSGPDIWSDPQTVTMTGRNDEFDDGDVAYTIVTAPATSADASYNGIDAVDVPVTNLDDGDTAGITVTPTSGLVTNEAGGQATFTVVLDTEPTADVTIAIMSSDTSEGTVSTGSLTFTPSGPDIWSDPQTVTMTGRNDAIDDGDVAYTIVTAPATSADASYDGIDAADVSVTSVDDDTAGITVTLTSALVTDEAGGQATFTVVLHTEPTADVTIAITSTDTTEGTVSPGSLTFTPSGPDIWSSPQMVTVTGRNDEIDDGNVAYAIVTAPATSADASYDGIAAADVPLTNLDDGDRVGITVTPTSGLVTDEVGGQATFTVALDSEPTADVTIVITSSDTTEGTVSPGSLTFTPSGPDIWSSPQRVTVTGRDDEVDDGSVAYSIVTAPAASADVGYDGIDAPDVLVVSVDDDTAGITVTPTSGLTTDEAGGRATFTVVLDSEPTAATTIAITSSDTSEGTVSIGSLTFTPSGPDIWSSPQTVTVTGRNDEVDDGDVAYTIVTAPAASADVGYNGIDAADVSVTSVDDDTAGITVTPTSGLVTNEAGGQATFTVVLDTEPTASVTIGISSSDVTEGTVAPTSLTFTNVNWNTARTVIVTGRDDALMDGDVTYTILTAPATSSDSNYAGLDASDVSVTNNDND